MKKYFIFAASALALASCSSDDFLGENPSGAQGTSDVAIRFGGETGKLTRATSNTGDFHTMLDDQFKIYGVKAADADGTKFSDVFKNYVLWWEGNATGTASNTTGWEYVGSGSHGTTDNPVTVDPAQTIKYWDLSSGSYRFVAGSPAKHFAFNTGTNGYVETATVDGLAGHLVANNSGTTLTTDPVYIANPMIVAKDFYTQKKPVQFTFVRQQSKVRVGVYETIPGYKITKINFYEQGKTTPETTSNIILTSPAETDYFIGTDITNPASATITYDWDKLSYSFKYNTTNLKHSKNWYAGAMDGVPATTSTESTIKNLYGEDKDMDAATGYFTVLPNTATDVTASPLFIKCDYVLESEDGSGETIKVTGATAAIPAAFAKWEPNTLYTYLFKISQNTNGTTGTGEDTPGLFPITFDAVVAQEADATHQGTTTTVQTPSITTNQEGSVTDKGIKYVAGKAITATVTENTTGDVKGITDATVKVYKLTKVRTEAELQMANVFATEITDQTPLTISINNNVLSFTPEEGYYAIQYQTAAAAGENTQAAYTYKIVHVEAAPGN